MEIGRLTALPLLALAAACGDGAKDQGADGGADVSACEGAMLTVKGDGAEKHFDAVCSKALHGAKESEQATAYLSHAAASSAKDEVVIQGCLDASQPHSAGSLYLDAPLGAPGTSKSGSLAYEDGAGNLYQADVGATVTLTRLDPVGGSVEGSFEAASSSVGQGSKTLSGTFRVCRVSDVDAP